MCLRLTRTPFPNQRLHLLHIQIYELSMQTNSSPNCDDNDDWFLADEDCWESCWSVLACSLVAVGSDSWCTHPTEIWTGEGLGWGRLRGCSLSLPPASFLRGFMPLPRTYDWLFSLMSASCLGLRPPAAVTDGWLPPVQAVSSAGLCDAFLEHHDRVFLLRVSWRRLL